MVLHEVEELADQEIFPGLYNAVEISKVREAGRWTGPSPR